MGPSRGGPVVCSSRRGRILTASAPTGATEQDVNRIPNLAEVAVHTDDRNLLQQSANDARDAYSTGSSRYGEHQRRCWRWRRGISTTSMTRCTGLATSAYLGHHFSPRY